MCRPHPRPPNFYIHTLSNVVISRDEGDTWGTYILSTTELWCYHQWFISDNFSREGAKTFIMGEAKTFARGEASTPSSYVTGSLTH